MSLTLDALIAKLIAAREFVPGDVLPEIDVTLDDIQRGLPQIARVAIYGHLVRVETESAGIRKPQP